MSQHLGPETRAIIEAINGLKKPAHEDLNYLVVTLDLTVARANELYELPGWFDFLGVGKISGDVSVRINTPTMGLIDLARVKTMKVPIRRLYFTHAAQPGGELTLGLGGEASFSADPLRSTQKMFRYVKRDVNGATAAFEPSYAKTDTPVTLFDSHTYPLDLKDGIANRIHYRLTATNAVTYTVRIYARSNADDVLSESSLIYESPAGQVSGTEYQRNELVIPFQLIMVAQIFLALEWSAAPGVTLGYIEIFGDMRG